MLTAEQKELRKKGIGASEAAAALGMSAFEKGPLHVWASKVIEEDEPEVLAPRLAAGHKVERILVPRLYEEDRGVRLVHNEKTYVCEAPLLATPDFFGPDRFVEAKNTGERMADSWGESGVYETWEKGLCPFDYFVQGQLQCHGVPKFDGGRYEWFDLAVLIGGWDFRVLSFRYDPELAAGVVQGLRDFYETFVVPKVQPPADGSPGAMSILRQRFPKAVQPLVSTTDATELAAIARLAAAKEWMKQAKEEEEAACAHMAELIGDREGLTCPMGKVVWRNQRANPKYKDVAEALGATQQQIDASRGPDIRVMNWYPTKEKKSHGQP